MREDGGRLRWLPVGMFVVFAAFWGTVDVLEGLWLALIPSVLVTATLVAGPRWLRPGGRS